MEKLDIPLHGPEEPPQNNLHEWMLRRIEERILRRVTVRFAIVSALLVLLAVAGLVLFRARLETTLLAPHARSSPEPLEREGSQRIEKRLAELEEELAKARARVQELADETERRLGERAEEARRLVERAEEVSRTRSEQTAASLERLRAELAGLERRTGVVGIPLAKKLEVLAGLRLDPRDADAEAHRATAVQILRDLANAELVRTENLEALARKALARLAEERRLRDDMFTEVRVRTLRAVAELRLVDIASARSADPASWDRTRWILLLGALGEVAGMPSLAGIAGNGKEPAEARVAALRALASFRIAGTAAREGSPWADEEIAALAPTRRGPPAISPDRQEVRQALRTAVGVVTNRRESPAVRRAALAVLGRIGDESSVSDLRLVLYEEWSVLGEEVLKALTEIGGSAATSLLRDFALAPLGGTDLRLRAVGGLQALGGRQSLAALERITREVTDDEVAVAAQRALTVIEEHAGAGSPPRGTGDLRPPRPPR